MNNYKIFDKKGEFAKLMSKLLGQFKNGEIVEQISLTYLRQTSVPSDKWSVMNKILMMLEGTSDARTYNAWTDVGRKVKPGTKAFYIIKPMIIPVKEFNEDKQVFETKEKLIGFCPQPEFKIENTEGKDVEYVEKVSELPKYQEIAKGLGVSVTVSRRMFGEKTYGTYNSETKGIKLHSKDSHVFFHELAHAAHDIYLANKGKKMAEQSKEYKEIVAEFGGLVIARLYGYKIEKGDLGFCQQYIKSYTKSNDTQQVYNAIADLIKDIEGIVKIVIQSKKKEEEQLITVQSK